jgi:hypothetical protein
MARKPIPEETQRNVVLKSRRRCCLCFWLTGKGEVQKGQIAHLDGNNENASEDNLVFLCFDHHDEYDGTPRLAKGLRPGEVKHWRTELYKEMLYRFRSIKTKSAELIAEGIFWQGPKDECSARFRVKNTGEVELARVLVSIRLPEGVLGDLPPQKSRILRSPSGLMMPDIPMPDMWAAAEERQDLFEPNGRVCVKGFHPMYALMPGHSDTFDALLFNFSDWAGDEAIGLEYRIDAEGMPTVVGKASLTMPSGPDEMLAN